MAFNQPSVPYNAVPMPLAMPLVNGNSTSCIRVSNLPKEATEPWLRLVFSTFGTIEELEMYSDIHPGSAIIRFATPEQASRALQLDGSFSHGSALHVYLEPQPQAALAPPTMMNAPHFPRGPGGTLQHIQPFMPMPHNGGYHSRQPTSSGHTREVSPSSTTSSPDSAYGGSAFHKGSDPRHSTPPRQLTNSQVVHKNLYVLNLPLDATTDQLASLFSSHGTVVHCVILAMLDAQARRRGFIDMSSPVEAKEAIECLNGYVWNGYPIEVSYAIVQRSGGPLTGPNVVRRTVPRSRWNCGPRRQPIQDGSFGDSPLFPGTPVNGGHVQPYDHSYQSSAGDTFATSQPRQREMQSNICVDPYTIFLTGLDPAAILDDEDLCHFVQVFGTVVSCSLSRDENGISLGYGVATFAAPAEATYAREVLDGQTQSGNRLGCKNLHFTRDPWAGALPGPLSFDRPSSTFTSHHSHTGGFDANSSFGTNGSGSWPSEVDYFTPRSQAGTLPPPVGPMRRAPTSRDHSANGTLSTAASSTFSATLPDGLPLLSLAGSLPAANPLKKEDRSTPGSVKAINTPGSLCLSLGGSGSGSGTPLASSSSLATTRRVASSPITPVSASASSSFMRSNSASKNVWGEPAPAVRGPRKVEPEVPGIALGPIGSSPPKRTSSDLNDGLALDLEKLFLEVNTPVNTPVAGA